MNAAETSWEAATREGLSFFWAHMHLGHTIKFVGQSWEDGGFSVGENGKPYCDPRGNTVARSTVEELNPDNAEHVSQVEEWYGN